jgi:hypothetical protein
MTKIKGNTAEYFFISFLSKNAIYLSQGLHEGRLSYKRSLQPSKENIQHFKTLNLKTFAYFCGSFCPPGSGSRGPIESGSTTLVKTKGYTGSTLTICVTDRTVLN